MTTSHYTLPSGEAMEDYCHLSPDRFLPHQSLALLVVLTAIFCLLLCIPAVIASFFSFFTGAGFWNEDLDALSDWTRSTISYGLACAAPVIALSVFVRTYMRTHFGRPSYVTELEAELSRDSVLQICRAYLTSPQLEKPANIEESRNRVIGRVKSSQYAKTYLEVRTVQIDDHTTRIVVRAASVPFGRAALFSAFYTDLGGAREAANQLARSFSAYASRRRRTTGQWSKQVRPRMKPAKYTPPPNLRVPQAQ